MLSSARSWDWRGSRGRARRERSAAGGRGRLLRLLIVVPRRRGAKGGEVACAAGRRRVSLVPDTRTHGPLSVYVNVSLNIMCSGVICQPHGHQQQLRPRFTPTPLAYSSSCSCHSRPTESHPTPNHSTQTQPPFTSQLPGCLLRLFVQHGPLGNLFKIQATTPRRVTLPFLPPSLLHL